MNHKSKRVMMLVTLAVSGALSLSACSGGGSTPGTGSDTAGEVPSWCGHKQISLAMLDGFGGNAWRQIAAKSGRQEAAKCPSVKSFEYSDAQGDTQKAISDIKAMVATGVNAMVVFPDAGEAVLPALRSAYKAGVVTVPYRTDPGGKNGIDYNVWIGSDFVDHGVTWGQWIKEKFPNGAKILDIGGPAGNSQGLAQKQGLKSVLTDAKYEWIGTQPFEVTDWDPAKTQQVLTAAIARYDHIDVIVGEYGASLVGALPRFPASGRSIPAVLTEDGHAIACFFNKNKDANPDFNLVTVGTGVDNVRLAIQHAVAIATGGKEPAETVYATGLFEDSTSKDHPVQCDPSLPADIHLSAQLTGKEQAAIVGG
ncbi:substrate-binding domain-containing protein [Micromonospora sp. NPDC048830]|uniref:substrate-binding domain-containing protein n=1 Tax=Micromonospora sp. NPDC048830 TaxID=3364257 RepID=UPI0037213B36